MSLPADQGGKASFGGATVENAGAFRGRKLTSLSLKLALRLKRSDRFFRHGVTEFTPQRPPIVVPWAMVEGTILRGRGTYEDQD
jgi:hypothetical protein